MDGTIDCLGGARMRFILVCFALMGWAFYELSGGSDFKPRGVAAVDGDGSAVRLVAGRDAVVPDPVKIATVITAPEITRVSKPEPKPTAVAAEPARASVSFEVVSEATGNATPVTLASLERGATELAKPLSEVAPVEEVAATPAPEPERLDIRAVTGSRVNMREGPGTDFGILTSLVRGAEVEVLEITDNGWMRLRPTDGGPVGWMSGQFISDPAG